MITSASRNILEDLRYSFSLENCDLQPNENIQSGHPRFLECSLRNSQVCGDSNDSSLDCVDDSVAVLQVDNIPHGGIICNRTGMKKNVPNFILAEKIQTTKEDRCAPDQSMTEKQRNQETLRNKIESDRNSAIYTENE